MSYTINNVKHSARYGAELNGHRLGNFRTLAPTVAQARCIHCSGSIEVHFRPKDGGRAIRGAIVARECPALTRAREAAQRAADEGRCQIALGWTRNDHSGAYEYGHCPAAVAGPDSAFVCEVLEVIHPKK